MKKDSINVWHSNGQYHIRHAGTYYRLNNYLEAKLMVELLMNSIWLTGEPANNNQPQIYSEG